MVIKYRRKRESKTNYKKRLSMLKSEENRLVIRISLKNISVQIIKYEPDGDKVLVSGHSSELVKLDWNLNRTSIPAAYLIGLLTGIKAKSKGIKTAIPDFGFYRSSPGSKVYAVIKGVLDAGLKINASETMFPEEKRIKGMHISEFAKKLKEQDEEAYKKQFSFYLKKKIDPESISKLFEETKKKILIKNERRE